VLEETGLTVDDVREYAEEHSELQAALYKVPHYKGTIGSAANFVKHVAELMKRDRREKVSGAAV